MSIFRQLMNKWFGIEEPPCEACEILRAQLASSERERRELLHKLLNPEPPPAQITQKEELEPITPQFTPWRMRKQMLEAEDRRQAELLRQRAKEVASAEPETAARINELEQELGVK